MSTSSGGLTPYGLSQGGSEKLVSNSISKFQQLDFEISDSSLQSSTVLVDNFGHNSLSGLTDFHFVGSTSKTTVSGPQEFSVPSTMPSSPGQGSAEDKLDKMMAFLQTMQVKHEETVAKSEQKLLVNIHAVANHHDVFKAEVQSEIESLHLPLGQSSSVNTPILRGGVSNSSTFVPSTGSTSIPMVPSSSTGVFQSNTTNAVSCLNTISSNPQAHMMLMMTEAFSKLTTEFTETKTTNLKAGWPKFDGTKSKFHSWYLTILSQVSVPPWSDLYETISNELVIVTSNTGLNAKFYSKLLLSLEGEALRSIALCKHLCTDFLLLMQEHTVQKMFLK